ncbi:MAG: hypothetical protein ACI94Y_000986 [Maribacter sp.]|jgi:hypothetical protein
MPVEVRQISIKTNITSGNEDKTKEITSESDGREKKLSSKEREAIIQDCIEAISEMFEERNKR